MFEMLTEEQRANLKDAMYNFAMRALEPAEEDGMGLQKKVTEEELVILPQVLEMILES